MRKQPVSIPSCQKVKLADLEHNSDFSRFATISPADERRWTDKYEPARRILLGEEE